MAVDLEQDAVRDRKLGPIKDARNEARRYEKLADQPASTDPDDADGTNAERRTAAVESTQRWKQVREKAEQALDEQLKDLEISAYLIEALVRLEGFAGLRRGLQIARELVDQSWDQLYPLPDEYGLASRVLPLSRLNGEEAEGFLLAPIKRVPITEGNTYGPYSFWQLQEINDYSKFSDRERQARAERDEVSPERFKQAVKETAPQFFRQLIDDLSGCITEYKELNRILDERCGTDENGHSLAPPSSAISGLLELVMAGVKSIAGDRLPASMTAPEAVNGTAPAGGDAAAGQPGALRTREDAFHLLALAAEFFERTEPQSLLPAQIRKAIRWGRLTPDQYFKELIEDQHVVEQIFKQMGIPLSDGSEPS